MISFICGIYKLQQTRKYNRKEVDLPIQRTSGTIGGHIGVGEWEVQTIEYQTGCKDVWYSMDTDLTKPCTPILGVLEVG